MADGQPQMREVRTRSDRDRVCLSLAPACCRGLLTFAGYSSQHLLKLQKLCLGHGPECRGHAPLPCWTGAISWSQRRGSPNPCSPHLSKPLLALLGSYHMCTLAWNTCFSIFPSASQGKVRERPPTREHRHQCLAGFPFK